MFNYITYVLACGRGESTSMSAFDVYTYVYTPYSCIWQELCIPAGIVVRGGSTRQCARSQHEGQFSNPLITSLVAGLRRDQAIATVNGKRPGAHKKRV